jgi:hypothetical protein
MDETDQLRLQNTLERTPDYQTSTWVNPNTGYQYQATPVKPINKLVPTVVNTA